MTARVESLRGLERLEATTEVLQRTRGADATAGVWEAADVQWWWRRPRGSDELALPVWFDDVGPIAAAVLTDWGGEWQGDAVVVPGAVDLGEIWSALLDAADAVSAAPLDVLAREDDHDLLALLRRSGFKPTADRSGITWMNAEDRPVVAVPADGFRVVDRASRRDVPHPMRATNGDDVERRLRQCSLYDAELDLAVEGPDRVPAGYALFWYDATTEVGLVEPMRVHEPYRRRGLARALLTAGVDRLARRGARRLKVGVDSEAGEGGGTLTAWTRPERPTCAGPPPPRLRP